MYKAVVIGSGPGGYDCARLISALGGKVVIVEKNGLGGMCTNWGCIPTKALHASASLFTELKKASRHGLTFSDSSVDFATLMGRKEKIVNLMSRAVKKIMDNHKVEVILGEASIKDKHTVVVAGKELSTENIVLATGSQPIMLPGISIGGAVVSAREMLALSEMPSSLIVVGGGYIGCEFAAIYASLGVTVTLLEKMPRIVPHEDEEISRELSKLMQRQDITLITDATITSIEGNTVTFTQDKEEQILQSEVILVAVGLQPFFNKEELDTVSVKYDRGVVVNNRMQTSVDTIYAVGDVTGKMMLAHYAYAQAEVAARNIMGQTHEFDETIVPSCIFTIPEIASVGVRNEKLPSVLYRFAANSKARAMGEIDGFVKLYYEDGFLKGFSAIGPHVSDLVSEATLAIKNKVPLKKIKETIHPHPTLSETFLAAVELALQRSG